MISQYRSALASLCTPGRYGAIDGAPAVSIHERPDRMLLQVSGWPASFAAVCRKLSTALECEIPVDGKTAIGMRQWTIFRVAPDRLWIAGPGADRTLGELARELGDEAVVLELDHSRVVLRVAGQSAALLLNRGVPVDLDEAAFAAGAFAQSVVHGVSVLVHRVADVGGASAFDVYVPRDYAVSFWEWLIGCAQTLGYEVRAVP